MFSGHMSQSSGAFHRSIIIVSSRCHLIFLFLHNLFFSMNGLHGWGIWQSKYSLQMFTICFFLFLDSNVGLTQIIVYILIINKVQVSVLFSGTNSPVSFTWNQDHRSVSSTLEIFQCVYKNICRRSMRINLCNQSLAKNKLKSEWYQSFLRAALSLFFCTLDKYYKRVPNYPTTKALFPDSLVKLLVSELSIKIINKSYLKINTNIHILLRFPKFFSLSLCQEMAC